MSFLDKALLEAKKAAEKDEVPVGAVIVKDGKIIARGFNLRETGSDPCGHAEIAAIRKAAKKLKSWRLTGCVLYVTLEPCPMCLGACQQARVDRVIFGARDPKGGALSLGYRIHEDPRTNHRFPVEQEEHPKSGAILSEFFRRKRL